ncbi:flagellar FliJ family protein [Balneolaceae bacterium ANBcel3]|nr:flagellar FliJ family protein [Balneolaceae bacterium ANBcel3]
MKFKFSLEPVLKVREHKEKLQKQKLAEKQRQKQIISDKKDQVAAELEQFLGEKDKSAVYDTRKLRNAYAHLEQSHQLMGRLARDMDKADKAVSTERNKLVKAHRDTHIMEKVKDREHSIFKKQLEQLERKQMDEVASLFFNR